MPMSLGRRNVFSVAALAVVAFALGCADGTTAPKDTQNDDALAAFAMSAGGPAWPAFSFNFDPTRAQSYPLGLNSTLTIPANALCDPAKSSYGPTEWDKPCTLAKSSVKLMVQVWVDDSSNVRVEFSPAVRFSPTQTVMLSVKDAASAANPNSVILYCSTKDNCIDESLTDPSLKTIHDTVNGYVRRRIKHFSGYNVAARHGQNGQGEDYTRIPRGTN